MKLRGCWSHLLFLLGALLLALFASVLFGPTDLGPVRAWTALVRPGSTGADATIIWQIRLPRGLGAVLVGAALAVSGATFQALLRNPLAEPYILGVSGGAAVGVVGVLVLGVGAGAVWSLPLAAFLGALVAILAVFRIARTASHRLDPRVMILAGVVMGAFFNAVIMLLLSFAEAESVRSVVFWTMGSFGAVGWQGLAALAAYTIPASALLYAQARALNLLAIGEETAAYLGARVERVKMLSFFLASLLAAACVALAGVIGFVGLVVPHAVRLVWGSDHRFLLPASMVGGGAFLASMDLVARVAVPPTEIPIGAVTAFIGVPFFIVLLRKELTR